MKFLQLTSVLTAMSVLSVLPGMALAAQEKPAAAETSVPLNYAKDQYKACYKAKINWEGDSLVLRTDTPEWDSGVRINPAKGEKFLDLSKGKVLAVDVQNLSDKNQLRLTMHISTGSRKEKNFREAYTGIGLNPGEKRTMRLYLPHEAIFKIDAKDAHNLKNPLDTAKINAIEFKMIWPYEAGRKDLVYCRLSNLRLEGTPEFAKKIPGDKYMPFIDDYGQYKHGEWPEKIHSDADLKKNHEKELAELEKASAPAEWNRFGGWKNGPKLKATGYFRVSKYQNKWFFVDPEGRLFWSSGIDVLRTHTDATWGNKHPQWFTKAVPQDGLMPFTHWNLQKKYGKENYEADFFKVLGKRMTAWGVNTIGNWGADEFMLMGEKPYVLSLCDFDRELPKFKEVEAKDGQTVVKNSGIKFYDVFDPAFEDQMGNILVNRAAANPLVKKSITDPMCIGYFIDNELKFDRIMHAVMKAPADQPAKTEFVKGLKAKYKDSVEELNKAWNTKFASWEDVANNTEFPKTEAYRKDERAFYKKFVNEYFRICKQGIKSAAPHRLYLGCRFVGFRNPGDVWEATTKYCDVSSVNSYANSIANTNRGDFRGRPVIVGEFHFGTYDRGMFSNSLMPQYSQEDRAVSYKRYMQGALVHPNYVGAHYFQFRDQPLTGRYDGEGYQIGFVDVADTPYPEMTKAAREVGENMYQYRLKGKLENEMK